MLVLAKNLFISLRKPNSKRIDYVFKICFLCIVICAILYLSLFGISHNKIVTVLTDEFAYWASAAWLSGNDWSDTMINFPYYGYGYGLILFPLMKFCGNPIIRYQLGLVLNAIMLIGCFLLCYDCLKKLKQLNYWKRIIVSFIAISYSSNYLFTRITMSEILQTFIIWLLFNLIIRISIYKHNQTIILFLFTLAYLFCVHNRTIGIIAVGGICILIYYNKSILKIKNSGIIISFFIAIIIFTLLQIPYKNSVYSQTPANVVELNGFSSLSLLSSLLSFEGIKQVWISFCGKLSYAFIATSSIIFFGLIASLKKIIYFFRDKEYSKLIPYIFCTFSFLSAIAISAISTSRNINLRMDFLMYGRYSEYTYGPLLMIGMMEIISSKFSSKIYCLTGFFGLILTLIVLKYNPIEAAVTNFWINCTALSDLFYESNSIISTLVSAIHRSILLIIFIVCIFLLKWRIKQGLYIFALLIVSILWIKSAFYAIDSKIYSWNEKAVHSNVEFIKSLEDQEKRFEEIYIYNSPNDLNIAYLQFLKKELRITYVTTFDELLKLPQETFILTPASNKELVEQNRIIMDTNYNQIAENYFFTAWEKKV